MRSLYSLFAFSAAVVLVACGSDNNNGTTGGSTGVTPPTASTPSVSIDSGYEDRTAVVGSTIPANVHVAVNGVPTGGITVTWNPSTSGGTANPATSVSDANGFATTQWTLNDTVRVSTLTAAVVNASSVTLQVTTIGGAATTVSKVTADSVAVVAGASTLITVRVKDKAGNPVTGATITWTKSGGGALTATTTTTGSSGNGQVVFSTDATPKSYTVTATAGNLGSLTFKVVGL